MVRIKVTIDESILSRLRHLGYSGRYIAIPPDDGRLRKWEIRQIKKQALVLIAREKFWSVRRKKRGSIAKLVAEQTGLSVSTVNKLSMSNPKTGKDDPLTLIFEDCVRDIYNKYPSLRGKHVYVPRKAQAVRPHAGAVTTKSQVKALLKKGVQVSDIASAVGTGRSYVYQIKREMLDERVTRSNNRPLFAK